MKKTLLFISILYTSIAYSQNVIHVGSSSQFSTLKKAVDYLDVNMTQSTKIVLDDASVLITDSVSISLDYPLTIEGNAGLSTTLLAYTGLTGKPMITAYSPLSIRGCALYGRSLASYVTLNNEDAIQIKGVNTPVSLIDVGIINFYRGINISGGGTLSALYTTIDSCFRGIRVNTTDTTTLNYSTSEIKNCDRGISLEKGTYSNFALTNIDYGITSVDTAVYYDGANYTYYDTPTMIGGRMNGAGKKIVGFDFTIARDNDIYIQNVVGVENKNPHAKLNLVGATATEDFVDGVWRKLFFTATTTYTCKFLTGTDSVTYLPTYDADVMMWISGAIETTTQSSNINIGIVKNQNTATIYGQQSIFLDQNNRAFNFSTNAYIPDVKEGDEFSIWVQSVGANETLRITEIKWLIDAH